MPSIDTKVLSGLSFSHGKTRLNSPRSKRDKNSPNGEFLVHYSHMHAEHYVPESEIQLDFVRSSGPGGQNVNKVSSKAQLRWNVGGSHVFNDEQKAAIRVRAGKNLNTQDEIVLSAESERSQSQNKEAVIRRLQELVRVALAPKKKRKPTEVSRSQQRKRLDDKRITSDKKQSRKSPRSDW